MKRFYLALMTVFIALSLSLTGCEKEPAENLSDAEISVEIINSSDGNITFSLSCNSETEPSLYAYMADERGLDKSAEDIYENGTKTVPKAQYTISGLEVGKEYTLYVTARVSDKLVTPVGVDFKSDAFASSTDNSITVRIDNKTHNSLTYSLVSGKNVVKGFMTVLPRAWLNNYYYEGVVDGVTKEDLVSDLLLGGYGLEVVGEEKMASWTATPILPAADYSILVQAILADDVPGDVTILDFSSDDIGVIGDPTLSISITDKNYMAAYFKYTINKDSYGYTRFITDKSEIDEYLQSFTEDDLREFLRFIDGTWMELGQTWDMMQPSTDGGNTKTKDEAINFGWDQGGLEFTALGVAFDKNLAVSKKYARLDGKLEEKPVNTPKAEFTCELRDQSATTVRIHSEFEETCARAYCIVVPSSMKDQYLENPEETSRQLWYDGWVISREKLSPDSPIFNQDDLIMDLSPETEYVLIATAINFDGVLNEELFVSEPITTKKLTFSGSEADIQMSVVEEGKTLTRLLYKATDQTVEFYHAILEKDMDILSASEEEIRTYLMEKGNIWAWHGDKDPDWDAKLGGVAWTWTGMDPGTEYVSIACAQDTEGRVSSVNRLSFSTIPLTPGDNPDVTFNIYDITSNSFVFDMILNDEVGKVRYMIVQDQLLGLDESSDEKVVSETLYENLLLNGTDGYESLRGVPVDKLPESSRLYICAIAYGAGDAEKFRYDVIQLTDPNASYSVSFPDFCKLYGGEEKSFTSIREKNRELNNEPLRKDGVIYFNSREDFMSLVNEMGYTPISLKEATEKAKELFRINK